MRYENRVNGYDALAVGQFYVACEILILIGAPGDALRQAQGDSALFCCKPAFWKFQDFAAGTFL